MLPHVAKGRSAGSLRPPAIGRTGDVRNAGLITDIIACPGLDYCALANARSIPVAQRISERFADLDRQLEIGDLKIKISGCINACGHHHVGHIGILGVGRRVRSFTRSRLAARRTKTRPLVKSPGAVSRRKEVVDAIETIVDTYLGLRESAEETFLAAYRRVGMDAFQTRSLWGDKKCCLTPTLPMRMSALPRKPGFSKQATAHPRRTK
ncbi:hypothetical protein VXQ18_14380 [Brucella abortus]|nr:hypothetical protein [Brucella abortus]